MLTTKLFNNIAIDPCQNENLHKLLPENTNVQPWKQIELRNKHKFVAAFGQTDHFQNCFLVSQLYNLITSYKLLIFGQVKKIISFPSGITKNMRREVLIICYFVNFCYFPKYRFTTPLLPIKR